MSGRIISKILNWPKSVEDNTFWKVIIGFAFFIYGITLVGILFDPSDWELHLLLAVIPVAGFTLISWIWKKATPIQPTTREEGQTRPRSITKQYMVGKDKQLVLYFLALIIFFLAFIFTLITQAIPLAITILIGWFMILVIGFRHLC